MAKAKTKAVEKKKSVAKSAAKKSAAKSLAKKPVKALKATEKATAKAGAKTPRVRKAALTSAPVSPLERYFGNAPVIHREGGRIRVLVGKAGLDGHDRGAKVIARAFRDAGFEVVYTGLHQTAEMIVNTAIQEDVDVLGISILSGAHNYLVPEIAERLRKHGVELGQDMLLIVGGIIPDQDFAHLKENGVSMVFTPGSSVDSIIDFVRSHVKPKG